MERSNFKTKAVIKVIFTNVNHDKNGNTVANYKANFQNIINNTSEGYEFTNGKRRVQIGGGFTSAFNSFALKLFRNSHFNDVYSFVTGDNYCEAETTEQYNRNGRRVGVTVYIIATLDSKREIMSNRIRRHNNTLNELFYDPKADFVYNLSQSVYRIETAGNRQAEKECSYSTDQNENNKFWEAKEKLLYKKLPLLKEIKKAVVFNGDCRGYCLKIDSEKLNKKWFRKLENSTLFQDWGGYFILSPELNGEI